MKKFKAYRIHLDPGGRVAKAGFEELHVDDLTQGELVVEVEYSCVNYKDALAATGKGKILRKSPLVGGIDLAGRVLHSESAAFSKGDEVVVCGAELSELYDGGYSEIARVREEAAVPLPRGMSTRDAMSIGTAGFTAALAVMRMQDNHQVPSKGPVLVTGATGGVGSFAVDMLSGLGFDVTALTGKRDQESYLRGLGACSVLFRDELDMGSRPLEKAIWGGAVDNLGGDVLGWLTRTVKPFGNIACIGLAAGAGLNTTVMPFILRGVSLLGVNSVLCSQETRRAAWSRLASDLRPRHLDRIVTREIEFEELPTVFEGYTKGESLGRTVVRIKGRD